MYAKSMQTRQGYKHDGKYTKHYPVHYSWDSSVKKMKKGSFVYLPSLLYHPHLVCITFWRAISTSFYNSLFSCIKYNQPSLCDHVSFFQRDVVHCSHTHTLTHTHTHTHTHTQREREKTQGYYQWCVKTLQHALSA